MTFSDNHTIKEFVVPGLELSTWSNPKHCIINRAYKGLFVNFLPKTMVTQVYGPYGVYRNEILEQI